MAENFDPVILTKSKGSETNTPTIQWAMMFLSQMPSFQEKAYQAIVDAHGEDFDPLLDGEVDYVMGFTKEILRFYTPLRESLPRATWTEVLWEGSRIPPNTAVFLNAWACNRGANKSSFSPTVAFTFYCSTDSLIDPEAFPDPDSFIPERWLKSGENETAQPQFAFGFGTRMCVAYRLATQALYVAFLQILANYKILPGDSETGDFGEDNFTDLIDPLKGVVDPTSQGSSPLLLPLKLVPRHEKRLRERLES